MRAFALGATVLLALVFGPASASAQLVPPTASADLRSASGDEVATATFAQASDEVRIAISFRDRTSLVGTHAIHIHSVAQCTPPSFDSAGPILNPTSKQHGLLNPDGPMAGDLPNLVIGPAGVAVYNLSATLVSVGPGPGANSLLGGRGTSLIIFSQPDDNSTQPDGNAGQRIACGPIVAGLSTPPPASQRAGDAGISHFHFHFHFHFQYRSATHHAHRRRPRRLADRRWRHAATHRVAPAHRYPRRPAPGRARTRRSADTAAP